MSKVIAISIAVLAVAFATAKTGEGKNQGEPKSKTAPYQNIIVYSKKPFSFKELYEIKIGVEEHSPTQLEKLNSKNRLQIRINNDFIAVFDSSLSQLRELRAKKLLISVLTQFKTRTPFSYAGLAPELQELLAANLAKEVPGAQFKSDTKLVISPIYHQDFTAEGFRFGFGALELNKRKQSNRLPGGALEEEDPVEKELSNHGIRMSRVATKEETPKPTLTYIQAPLKTPGDQLMGESQVMRDFALWVQNEHAKLDQRLEEVFLTIPKLAGELKWKQYKTVEEIARADPKKFEQIEMFADPQLQMNGVPESKRRELLMKCSISHSFTITLGVVVQGTTRWVTLDFDKG